MWKKAQSQDEHPPVFLTSSLADGIQLDCQGNSTIGRRRVINQDRWIIMPFSAKSFPEWHDLSEDPILGPVSGTRGYLFGVADGIGGAPAGERASLIVVETLEAFIKEEGSTLLRAGRPDDEITGTLIRGLRRCQAALAEQVGRHPEYRGMGTTLTAALVLWPRLYLFHLGDSRAYLLRGGRLRRLTQDQTYARFLVEAGILAPKNVDRSQWKHVVRNILGGSTRGGDPEVHPEVHIQDLRAGDILLLCTDGLSNPLADETIRGLLSKGGSSEDLCSRLLDSACARRAQDDATVLVARFADSHGELG